MNSKSIAKIFKALSNQNRLELYLEIAKKNEAGFETGNECFISDIAGCLNIGAPTVSHHLKELENAGLIITEKRGKFLIARINRKIVNKVNKIMELKFKPDK